MIVRRQSYWGWSRSTSLLTCTPPWSLTSKGSLRYCRKLGIIHVMRGRDRRALRRQLTFASKLNLSSKVLPRKLLPIPRSGPQFMSAKQRRDPTSMNWLKEYSIGITCKSNKTSRTNRSNSRSKSSRRARKLSMKLLMRLVSTIVRRGSLFL